VAARQLWHLCRRHLGAGVLADPAFGCDQWPDLHRARAVHVARARPEAGHGVLHAFDLVQLRPRFATSVEMELTAEADTGVTADEWMDVQMPALTAVLADQDLPAFRAVLDSFMPDGFDMDLDELSRRARLFVGRL
jgi:hypothetical protein